MHHPRPVHAQGQFQFDVRRQDTIPILPLLCLWDGIVSCLRSYSARELRELVRDLESEDYTWDVGELRFPGTPVTVAYLIGLPAGR